MKTKRARSSVSRLHTCIFADNVEDCFDNLRVAIFVMHHQRNRKLEFIIRFFCSCSSACSLAIVPFSAAASSSPPACSETMS